MSVPTEAIERARDADLLDLAAQYGAALKRVTANEFAGSCPVCGRGDHAPDRFAINIRSRTFLCRQCGIKGKGAIDLVMQVEKVGLAEAVWHLTGTAWEPSEPRRPIPASSLAEAVTDRASDVARALRWWGEAVNPRGTLVERYLEGRALKLDDAIAGTVVRFHPAAYWREDDGAVVTVPAMLCAMRNIRSDEIVAVSRRRLSLRGEGRQATIPGVGVGAAVKLDRDEDVTDALHICEGVETGIAGRMLGLKPMWALGSKDAIRVFPVLNGISTLTICAEPDAENQVEQCARRWWEAGRDVVINRATIGKDLADAIFIKRGGQP